MSNLIPIKLAEQAIAVLEADIDRLRSRYAEVIAENARLKAEVEAQAKRWAESEDLISHYKQQMDEVINNCQCSRLKAEVERLRKAGDELVKALLFEDGESCKEIADWNAAKEGKPSV